MKRGWYLGMSQGGGAVSAIGDVIDTYLKSEIVKY